MTFWRRLRVRFEYPLMDVCYHLGLLDSPENGTMEWSYWTWHPARTLEGRYRRQYEAGRLRGRWEAALTSEILAATTREPGEHGLVIKSNLVLGRLIDERRTRDRAAMGLS